MQKKIVNLYENSNQLVNAAIDKVVVEIFNKREQDAKTAQTIVLFGASPLAGTTSTSIDLAIATANTGRKVLLIDCDVRKAAKYKKLNEQVDKGLADYLLQEVEEQTVSKDNMIEEIIYKTNVENLSYIPCGSYSENPTRIMCSTRMEPLLEEMKNKVDYIICDLPAISVVPDAQIFFPFADGIILLTALGETRKKEIKEAKRKIEPFLDKYYGMVINKIEQDIYRKNVKNYDYYLKNVRGEQQLGGHAVRKEYEKKKKQIEKMQSK